MQKNYSLYFLLLVFLTNVLLACNCHLPVFIFNLWCTQKREVCFTVLLFGI
jgi:hypothetical protein